MDVVGIGKVAVDLLANVPKIPKEDDRTTIKDYSWQGGGKVPTALVALARLGAKCGMITIVGDCNYGRFCIEDFKYHGVDVSQIVVDKKGQTPFSIVLSDDYTHGRSIMHYPGTCRSLEISDLDKDYVQSARYLHLAYGTPASRQGAIWAREKGIPVVFDADYYRPDIEEMIPLIDVFIASEFYYKAIFDDEDYERNCKKIQSMGPDIVVFTLGQRGCVGIKGNMFFMEDAFRVAVKDTTGAGDVYHGAFIYGLLQNWDIQKIARFSNAVAAIKCTRIGGRAAIPTLETVTKFLDTGIIDYAEIDKRVVMYRRSI